MGCYDVQTCSSVLGTWHSITVKRYGKVQYVPMQGLDHAEQPDGQFEGAEPRSDQPHGCSEW